MKAKNLLMRIFGIFIALLNIVPSITVIFNPLLFVMYFPLGIYAVLTWPWTTLREIPDPFHPGESLYWLTYAITIDNPLFPSLFRWGILDITLTVVGLTTFFVAFVTWITNLKKGLITHGVYRIIRHPQYLGIIIFTLGLSLRSLRPISLIAWLTLTFSYLILASLEEKHLLSVYKEEYEEYCKRTPFIIPFLRLNVPSVLSSKSFFRYLLLFVLYLLLVILVVVTTRNMVVALRDLAINFNFYYECLVRVY